MAYISKTGVFIKNPSGLFIENTLNMTGNDGWERMGTDGNGWERMGTDGCQRILRTDLTDGNEWERIGTDGNG